MAPSADGPQRPTMRRKSSAQNLLSSFNKQQQLPTQQSGSSTPSLPTLPPPPPPPSFASAASFSSATSFATAATPTAREWDAQSIHSDQTGTTSLTVGSPPFTQASVEYLRDMVQKRIITLTYLRNVYDGGSHWFHTIAITRLELDKSFDNASMKKRTYRFTILAMSLAALLDVSQPSDLLRGLLNTLTEYEQNKDEGDRQRLRIWRKPPKKQGGSIADYSVLPDAADGSYLTIPHVPFPLDYTTTLLSLLDILSALYAKIAKLLGPSPFPHASQHMLGLSAPHPGVSYLFQSGQSSQIDGELYEVAFGGSPASQQIGGGLSSPPPSWTPQLGESVLKVDGKFKKITSMLLKELDVLAREQIHDELGSLDPLLRNLPINNGFDFDNEG